MAVNGNGLELVSTAGAGQLAALVTNSSPAARDLGLVAEGADASSTATVSGGNEVVTGRDVNPLEATGAYNALVRLHDALQANDDREIERTLAQLTGAVDHLVFVRSEVGAQQQGLDALETHLDDEDTELRRVLSDQIDADAIEVISQLTARQASFEATLRATARIYQVSLLDFL